MHREPPIPIMESGVFYFGFSFVVFIGTKIAFPFESYAAMGISLHLFL